MAAGALQHRRPQRRRLRQLGRPDLPRLQPPLQQRPHLVHDLPELRGRPDGRRGRDHRRPALPRRGRGRPAPHAGLAGHRRGAGQPVPAGAQRRRQPGRHGLRRAAGHARDAAAGQGGQLLRPGRLRRGLGRGRPGLRARRDCGGRRDAAFELAKRNAGHGRGGRLVLDDRRHAGLRRRPVSPLQPAGRRGRQCQHGGQRLVSRRLHRRRHAARGQFGRAGRRFNQHGAGGLAGGRRPGLDAHRPARPEQFHGRRRHLPGGQRGGDGHARADDSFARPAAAL